MINLFYPNSIAFEDIVATAIIVIIIRNMRLCVITRFVINFFEIRNIIRAPITLSITSTLMNHIIIEIRGHILLHGFSRNLLHYPHNILLLSKTVQIDCHPLPLNP